MNVAATLTPVTAAGLDAGDGGAFRLVPGSVVTVGRAPDNMLCLGEAGVSGRHARLSADEAGWQVEDLGSTNGTRVNGGRISAPTRLQAGDEVSFGGMRFRFGFDRPELALGAVAPASVPSSPATQEEAGGQASPAVFDGEPMTEPVTVAEPVTVPMPPPRPRLAVPPSPPPPSNAPPQTTPPRAISSSGGRIPWLLVAGGVGLAVVGLGVGLLIGRTAEGPPAQLPTVVATASPPTASPSTGPLPTAAPPAGAPTTRTVSAAALGGASPLPPAGTFAAILAAPSDGVTYHGIAANPLILIADYGRLELQADALNRIAALVEKGDAPKDRVLGIEEFTAYLRQGRHGVRTFYLGHDYRAADLARFFTLAGKARLPLTAGEAALRERLLDFAVMRGSDEAGYQVVEPAKALISITQEEADDPATPEVEAVSPDMRAIILRHELSHGEFFTNPTYRAYVLEFWSTVMSEADRAGFRKFLGGAMYDTRNEELMANEMQAYLVHTPDRRAFNPGMVGLAPERVAALRQRFAQGMPVAWLMDEAAFAQATGR